VEGEAGLRPCCAAGGGGGDGEIRAKSALAPHFGRDRMPYQLPAQDGGGRKSEQCTVCEAAANVLERGIEGNVVDCSRCGDFSVSREAIVDFGLPLHDLQRRALASYLIRKSQGAVRPRLTTEFFSSLAQRALPTPSEASDNPFTLDGGQSGRRIREADLGCLF
jgi:hypothetical protein